MALYDNRSFSAISGGIDTSPNMQTACPAAVAFIKPAIGIKIKRI